MSARIDENGVKTKKIWLKQGSRGLFVKKQSFQGLDLKKPGAKTKLNLNFRGVARKKVGCGRLWTAGTIFLNLRGFTINIWTKT